MILQAIKLLVLLAPPARRAAVEALKYLADEKPESAYEAEHLLFMRSWKWDQKQRHNLKEQTSGRARREL